MNRRYILFTLICVVGVLCAYLLFVYNNTSDITESAETTAENYFEALMNNDAETYQSLLWRNRDKSLDELKVTNLGIISLKVNEIKYDMEVTKQAHSNYINSDFEVGRNKLILKNQKEINRCKILGE